MLTRIGFQALVSKRLGDLFALIAGLSIPAIVVLAWRQGLFSGVPASFRWLLAGIGSVGLLLLLSDKFLKRLSWSPGSFLALLSILGFVAYSGPAVAFAAAVIGLVALALVPGKWLGNADGGTLILVVGIATLVGCVGWLLPFPLHGPRIYLLLAALLLLVRRRVLRERLGMILVGWQDLGREARGWQAAVAGAGLLASMGLWLPTMNYDDNAAHLILPYQLLRGGYYHLDASTQAWALAPWANNALNGIAAVLAGVEARAAVNAIWLLVGMNGAWRLAIALGAQSRGALAAVVVWVTLPFTGYFTTTMQVDGASGAILLHLAALLVTSRLKLPSAWVVGALLGLLAGLKVTNAIYVLPAAAWLTWLAFHNRDWVWLVRAVMIALLLGTSSYIFSVWITGNPLFPLYNATFQSPYYPPVDIVDRRWMMGLSVDALWDLTFHTDRFGEFYPGAFGLALVALLPALTIEMARHPVSRLVGLWFIISGILVFSQIQYARYAFPASSVLVVIGSVGLSRLLPSTLYAALMGVLVVANTMLLPSTSWLLSDNPWGRLITQGPGAVTAIEAEKIPERLLLRRVLDATPGACVMIVNPEAPFGAIAGGRANVSHPVYDSRMMRTYNWANEDGSGQRWLRVLSVTGTSHVITGPVIAPGLEHALVKHGFQRVDLLGASIVWASIDPSARSCGGNMIQSRDEAHRRFHPWDHH